MQEFNVSLADKPGELAEVASAVGENGINILGCVGMGRSSASVTMVTDDEEATTKVLKDMGRDFEANELLLTTLSNEPGALAKMATKLSDAGINIIFLGSTSKNSSIQIIAIALTARLSILIVIEGSN